MIAVCLFLFAAITQISLNGEILNVELALTEEEHYQGLKERTSLRDDQGMLFIYEKPEILSFWMKDTKIPLSVGFFDENRCLINIRQMRPARRWDETIYKSERSALYALEVQQGWFRRHDVKVGDTFEWIVESR